MQPASPVPMSAWPHVPRGICSSARSTDGLKEATTSLVLPRPHGQLLPLQAPREQSRDEEARAGPLLTGKFSWGRLPFPSPRTLKPA